MPVGRSAGSSMNRIAIPTTSGSAIAAASIPMRTHSGIDEVGHGHEREEHRSDVGDDHADKQDHPDDGPERDRGQDHLAVLADLPEQEHARPPEGGRQDPAGEPAEHPEDRCKDRHAAILGERSQPAYLTARARPIGGVAGGRRKGGSARLRASARQ